MISNAFKMIKELGYSVHATHGFLEDDFTGPSIISDLNSTCLSVQKEGLKKILCMMQRGREYAFYYPYVLQISDTRDASLKRLVNHYLRCCCSTDQRISPIDASAHYKRRTASTYSGSKNTSLNMVFGESDVVKKWGAEHVLGQCTNTLLKDLHDKDVDLRNSALEFLIRVANPESFTSFARRIRKIMQSGSLENKARALLLIGNLSEKDSHFLEEQELVSDVLSVIRVAPFQLFVCGLKCLQSSFIGFIKKEEVVKFFEKVIARNGHELYYSGLVSIVNIILNIRETFSAEEIDTLIERMKQLLSRDLFTAFCIANVILMLDPNQSQYVFNKLCMYIHCRGEEQFHLLGFLQEIIQDYRDIKYENQLFAIFHSDLDYVKQAKLRILWNRPDEFAVNEILNLSMYPKFKMEVLMFCLENEVPNAPLFKECLESHRDQVENYIYYYRPDSDEWKSIICDEYHAEVLTRESIFIISYYFPCIPENLNEKCTDTGNLLKMYTNFYLRNIIDKATLKSYFKKLGQRDAVAKVEAIFLQKLLENKDVKALSEYANVRMGIITRPRQPRIRLEYKSEKVPIEKLRPFEPENKLLLAGTETINHKTVKENSETKSVCNNLDLKETNIESKKTTLDKNENMNALRSIKSNYDFVERPSDRRFHKAEKVFCLKSIANIWFTGKVLLKERVVFLKIESMARPFKVSSKELMNDKEILVSDISEHELGEIQLPQPFNIKINNLYGYSVNLSCKVCIEPVECDQLAFNDMFNGIDDYVILPKTFKANVYSLDKSNFSFGLLGDLFFGKVIDNGIVLKSYNRELLKAVAKDFE